MSGFELHAALARDTVPIHGLPLCDWRLMNDANYPWTILVPRRAGLRELYELDEAERVQFMRESAAVGRAMMQACGGHKLNVAALGNQVPQLHVHHIVRFDTDAAWPAPVWGRVPARPYAPAEAMALIEKLLTRLTL